MAGIRRDEIRVGEDYERGRGESRRSVALQKRHRRLRLGDLLALVFENRETVCSTIEEVVRAERLSDELQITRTLEAFAPLAPVAGELGATLYIEVADPAELADRLEQLDGVERSVYIEVGGTRVPGQPRRVAVGDEPPSAFLLGFALGDAEREAWLSGAAVAAGVDHPAVRERVSLAAEQRDALAADLRSAVEG